MEAQHRCGPLDKMNCSEAFRRHVTRNGAEWYLMTADIALECDVAAGEAEEVGETLSASELAISYCPFCGCELPKALC